MEEVNLATYYTALSYDYTLYGSDGKYKGGNFLPNGVFVRATVGMKSVVQRTNCGILCLYNSKGQFADFIHGKKYKLVGQSTSKQEFDRRKQQIINELRNLKVKNNIQTKPLMVDEKEEDEISRLSQIEIEHSVDVNKPLTYQDIITMFDSSKYVTSDNQNLKRIKVDEIFTSQSWSNITRLSYYDLMIIMSQSGVKLFDFDAVSEFLQQLHFKIPSTSSATKKRRIKRNHFLPGTIEYDNLKVKLDYIKKNFYLNKVGRDIVMLSYNYRSFCRKVICRFHSENDFYKIIFMASGTGKTHLTSRYPLCFFDIDDCKSKDQLNSFKNRLRFLKQKYKGYQNKMDFVWKEVNDEWKTLVSNQKDKIFRGNRVLLAHGPEQIPEDILSKSQCFIMLPLTTMNLRYQVQNLKHLLSLDQYDKIKVDYSMYLVFTMLAFQLDLQITRVRNLVVK